VAVGLALAAEALVTGAFHEDAVADFCDAFGGGWSRDDVIRILKDSRIGSFGTLGLGLAVFLRGSALATVETPSLLLAASAASGCLGRWTVLPALWTIPTVTEWQSLGRDVSAQGRDHR
jgi:adenosylcobinamide-GDP ribazoletransferase